MSSSEIKKISRGQKMYKTFFLNKTRKLIENQYGIKSRTNISCIFQNKWGIIPTFLDSGRIREYDKGRSNQLLTT